MNNKKTYEESVRARMKKEMRRIAEMKMRERQVKIKGSEMKQQTFDELQKAKLEAKK